MSISSWFSKVFRGPVKVHGDDGQVTTLGEGIDDARMDAGGSGSLGMLAAPDSHGSAGEEMAEEETESEAAPE